MFGSSNAPNTPKNRIAALIAIMAGLAVGFFLMVSGGGDDETAPPSVEETRKLTDVLVETPPAPPSPDNPARLEDIDFQSYSSDLARFVGLERGQSRIAAIDQVRLYFAPEEGAAIVQTKTTRFDRPDGSVMLFAIDNISDDSVRAQEIFLILSGPEGEQTLAEYGMRQKCWRGENTDNWQTALCP